VAISTQRREDSISLALSCRPHPRSRCCRGGGRSAPEEHPRLRHRVPAVPGYATSAAPSPAMSARPRRPARQRLIRYGHVTQQNPPAADENVFAIERQPDRHMMPATDESRSDHRRPLSCRPPCQTGSVRSRARWPSASAATMVSTASASRSRSSFSSPSASSTGSPGVGATCPRAFWPLGDRHHVLRQEGVPRAVQGIRCARPARFSHRCAGRRVRCSF
jgi:hypothetical protein